MERWQYIQNLNQRKEEVVRLIEEQGKLTEELKSNIEKAVKLQEVEDLYRPYKQKRRTKATAAKEKGLEPFAEWLLTFPLNETPAAKAKEFLSDEKEVTTTEEAIAGAKDIIAEWVSDEAESRKWIRMETAKKGTIESSVKNKEIDEKGVFEMYYEYEEPVSKIVPHRTLALNRGEKEEVLRINIKPNTEFILKYLNKKWVKDERSPAVPSVKEAIEDGYKRLIMPSIEREIRNELTEKAEEQAIMIFLKTSENCCFSPH